MKRHLSHLHQNSAILPTHPGKQMSSCPQTSPLVTERPTSAWLASYCDLVKRNDVINHGWGRAVVSQDGCQVNHIEWFRCPLRLLQPLLQKPHISCSTTQVSKDVYDEGDQVYGTPWGWQLYESNTDAIPVGNLVVSDFYADGATLAKSRTKGTTFKHIGLSNFQ